MQDGKGKWKTLRPAYDTNKSKLSDRAVSLQTILAGSGVQPEEGIHILVEESVGKASLGIAGP